MKILIGSKNPTKVKAVENVFPEAQVTALDVASDVALQPLSDEETKDGAVNRAKKCLEYNHEVIGLGLEAGVMYVANQLYLCNWGALATADGHTFTASGARIPLPKEIEVQLTAGLELGEVMDHYAEKTGIRVKEGAIGVFTNHLVLRDELFEHVVKLLRGQWEYTDQLK